MDYCTYILVIKFHVAALIQKDLKVVGFAENAKRSKKSRQIQLSI